MTDVIEVTHLYCPQSGGQPGEVNTTHHLRPQSAGGGMQQMVCAYCSKTEKELRDAASEMHTCARCQSPYIEPGAMSRYDNKSKVCPSCGQLEGMWAMQNPGQPIPGFHVLLSTTP